MQQIINSSSVEPGNQRADGVSGTNQSGKPLISIITVSMNSADTIEQTLKSVVYQTYDNIEYIVLDGGSTDATQEIARKYLGHIDYWRSGPDNGVYDAMNQGIALAKGDYIGFLNSDDFLSGPQVIENIVDEIRRTGVDAVFSGLDIVDRHNTANVHRRYRVNKISAAMLRIGIMPPHPTFYCRRSVYLKAGPYKTDYRIAADFEMVVRLFTQMKISWSYVDIVSVIMRTGGISNQGIASKARLNLEIIRACRENGLYTNPLLLLLKLPVRIAESLR
jgi:glycosyltransferase involved in cell wall biosynthesis